VEDLEAGGLHDHGDDLAGVIQPDARLFAGDLDAPA
jgi:hypothetical protein